MFGLNIKRLVLEIHKQLGVNIKNKLLNLILTFIVKVFSSTHCQLCLRRVKEAEFLLQGDKRDHEVSANPSTELSR